MDIPNRYRLSRTSYAGAQVWRCSRSAGESGTPVAGDRLYSGMRESVPSILAQDRSIWGNACSNAEAPDFSVVRHLFTGWSAIDRREND